MATSGPLSLTALRDAFMPVVWDIIKIRGHIGNHGCDAQILVHHQMDRLELLVSYDDEIATGILITRFETENISIKEYVHLIIVRINDTMDKVMPQYNPTDIFVAEYDDIISANDIYDKIQT